jgi:hypothetical protein
VSQALVSVFNNAGAGLVERNAGYQEQLNGLAYHPIPFNLLAINYLGPSMFLSV